jgi:hypothetical protein
VKDGRNWYVYVHGDPVNFVDPWGLLAVGPGDGTANEPNPYSHPGYGSDVYLTAYGEGESQNLEYLHTDPSAVSPARYENPDSQRSGPPDPRYFTQGELADEFGQNFADHACAATAAGNCVSIQYTEATGEQMTLEQFEEAVQEAIDQDAVVSEDDEENAAYVNNWENAANAMWDTTGLDGTFTYNANGEMQILAEDTDPDRWADHFVNALDDETYFDTSSGEIGEVGDTPLQQGSPTRGFDFQ